MLHQRIFLPSPSKNNGGAVILPGTLSEKKKNNMATIKNNPLTERFSGMLGDVIVFRQMRGKTVVANRPRAPKRQSERQKQNRERFREATQFAHAAMLDADKKKYYSARAQKLNLPNAYTAAITDYLRKPQISKVKLNTKQNRVNIKVSKKGFSIASAHIAVTDENGIVLAFGEAQITDRTKHVWTALLPKIICSGRDQMYRLVVTATDHTEHSTQYMLPITTSVGKSYNTTCLSL